MPGRFSVVRSRWLDSGLALACRGIGLLFIVSGVFKLSTLTAFAGIVGDYGLLPKFLHFPAALGLSLTEVAGGILLALNRRLGHVIVAALLVTFMAVLAYAMALGLDADCGCFGPSDPEAIYHGNYPAALARDLVLLAVLALARFRGRTRLGPGAPKTTATPTTGGIPA